MRGSRRLSVLETLKSRVEAIRQGTTYDTDAGRVVFVGELVELGEHDPAEAIAILAGDELPTFVGENVRSVLPVSIVALAKADLEQPYLAAEAAIGDIKRAIELSDRTLDGAVPERMQRGGTRRVQREAGSTTVGVAIDYLCPLTEKWGDP